jgi:hypothetical protein
VATCRSCGAQIEWATSERTNKPIPLNVGADPRGNLAVVAGKAHAYGPEDARLIRERRTSHFATCVDAERWRGPR